MRRNHSFACLLLLLAFTTQPVFAAPRDAEAVLNRCGKPLKGDTTILESTVTGGRRILDYERGTLHFDKNGPNGWTFSYGTHRKVDHLSAEQMEKYMPCLKDALADSASPEPLQKITPVQRVETSVKRAYKMLILYTLALLAVLGVAIFGFSGRKKEEHEQDLDQAA